MSGLKNLKLRQDSRLPESSVQTITAEPLKRLTIDLPESLHKRLKVLAAEQKTSIRDIVLRCVNTEIQK